MNNLAPLMTSARTGEIDRDEWRTPVWLFDRLHDEFHFTLDPAATSGNTLCEWYYDKEEDGLEGEWYGNIFVNPPYSQLKAWVRKGLDEARNNPKVANVVMLVPARTDTRAWWDYIRYGEVRFLPGRLRFVGAANSAPFPSAIVVFPGNGLIYKPSTQYWDIREPKYAVQ